MVQEKIDASKPYQFLSVEDCVETNCPHCGAEGRYIYRWAEYGVIKAAMAGCFTMLTGKLQKGDVEKHIERINVKLSRKKSLNGWDKTIVRMLKYKQENAGDEGKNSWADSKIRAAVSEAARYRANKF